MSQTITVKVKLLPTKEQANILKQMSHAYISTINALVSEMVADKKRTKKTSKHMDASLPSAVKNQAIKDAKSVFKKAKKKKFAIVPSLKKPVCIWNNQNWKMEDGCLHFPVWIEEKSKRIAVPMLISDYQKEKLRGKLGTLRITQKSDKWIAQIAVETPASKPCGSNVMGVDLGLKVPAVAVTDKGKTRFFGNGRMNKYMKRKFRSRRRQLGKAKKLSAIRKLNSG